MPAKDRKSTENVQHFKSQTQPNTTLATTTNQHQLPSDLTYSQPQQSHQQPQQQASQQQPAQQPPPPAYKHQNHLPAAGEGYSNANSIQPNVPLPPHPGAPNSSEAPPPADSSYFQPKPFQHTYPPQYYDYYDNKHKSAPPGSGYHINNYTSYGNLNFAPYHSNLHPPASYIGAPSSYVNSNVFPGNIGVRLLTPHQRQASLCDSHRTSVVLTPSTNGRRNSECK